MLEALKEAVRREILVVVISQCESSSLGSTKWIEVAASERTYSHTFAVCLEQGSKGVRGKRTRGTWECSNGCDQG